MNAPRLHTWPLAFEAFTRARRLVPLAWGANDCALFAADCVLALTGQDVAPPDLRLHKSAKQALQSLKRHDGLHSIASAALGPCVPVLTAGVGDVVLIKVGKREALAICNGTTVLGPGPAGISCLGLDLATACWRVG
jgi:hypothetical protein